MRNYQLVQNRGGSYGIRKKTLFGHKYLNFDQPNNDWVREPRFYLIPESSAREWFHEVIYGYTVVEEDCQ